MIEAFFYFDVYLFIVSIVTIITIALYLRFMLLKKKDLSYPYTTFIILVFFILFIGTRPISGVFVDMKTYDVVYNLHMGERFFFNWDTDNLIFDNLIRYSSAEYIPSEYFFFLMATIYFGFIYWACFKLFPNDILLSFITYLGAFSTFSYGTNGIKAGAAASIFLVALAYKDQKFVFIPVLLLCLGFHHSMIVPIVAFVIAYFVKKRKYYILFWWFSFFMAALHITFFQSLFSGFTDEHGAEYLMVTDQDQIRIVSGFRPDFILYSYIPIFLGDYYRRNGLSTPTFEFLLNVYTLTNSVFLLCTYGSSINRIAYLSWLMLPFVLIYPFLNNTWGIRRNMQIVVIVSGHLLFTLFMKYLYE